MRMSDGVEWALHACLLLDWLEDEVPVPTATLAAAFELPPPYLNKQLQALVKAGVLASSPGRRGGFRLARPAGEITLLDVVTAVEGPDEAFRCQEIRRRGMGASSPKANFSEQCAIAAAMRTADVEWRRALSAQTLADVRAHAERAAPAAPEIAREWSASRRV